MKNASEENDNASHDIDQQLTEQKAAVVLWRARFFEAQAAAEAFIMQRHGEAGIRDWIEHNAAIAATLLATPEAADKSDLFAKRLFAQLQLYDSEIELEPNADGSTIRNHRCGILVYRRKAEERGVELTFDTPCDYCQRLNKRIHERLVGKDSASCELQGDGCVWEVRK